MEAVLFNKELQKDFNNRRWELACQLLEKMNIKKLSYRLNNKYGWQRQDDLDDTEQELMLITFSVLEKYENKTGKYFLNFASITTEDKREIRKMITYQYRRNVWDNRSDKHMRVSDVYNLSPDDLESDTHLHFSTISTDDIADDTSDDEEDENRKKLRTKICNNLITILKPEVASMVNANILGNTLYGVLTHQEIADNIGKCRSAVTRRINRGIKFLSEFLRDFNISASQINYPTQKDLRKINKIIRNYKEANELKTSSKDINNLFKVKYMQPTIEDFLKSYTEEKSLFNNTPVLKIKRQRRAKKTDLPSNVTFTMHTIEEYL